MDDEELLFKQVQMTAAATPGTTVWIYRCTVYGYPWYTSVRRILEDPAYDDWWMHFKPSGVPQGLCKETANGSAVFVREWSKATIQMDCNSWTPTIQMKPSKD